MKSYIFEIYTDNLELYNLYLQKSNHIDDSGCDIYIPQDISFTENETKLIDLEITMKLIDEETNECVPFLVIPRSSIYKTALRLSNSIGLIDRGYNGRLHSPIDNITRRPYHVEKHTRLVQAVAPDLSYKLSIHVYNTLYIPYTSSRGGDGFGSTG